MELIAQRNSHICDFEDFSRSYHCVWKVEIVSIYQIRLTLYFKIPLDAEIRKHDIKNIDCLLLDTKYTDYKLIVINTNDPSSMNILSTIDEISDNDRKTLLDMYIYSRIKIWYFIFNFNFKYGIYHTLFHKQKFNYDVNTISKKKYLEFCNKIYHKFRKNREYLDYICGRFFQILQKSVHF